MILLGTCTHPHPITLQSSTVPTLPFLGHPHACPRTGGMLPTDGPANLHPPILAVGEDYARVPPLPFPCDATRDMATSHHPSAYSTLHRMKDRSRWVAAQAFVAPSAFLPTVGLMEGVGGHTSQPKMAARASRVQPCQHQVNQAGKQTGEHEMHRLLLRPPGTRHLCVPARAPWFLAVLSGPHRPEQG